MIKVIAVDDEPPALDVVEEFCNKMSDIVQLEGKFSKVSEAYAWLEANSVDLILLDINMPSITGIEFYKNLTDKPMAIFLTSYSEYAVESYNVNAVDYLMKPFTFQRFKQAIEKAIAVIGRQRVPGIVLNAVDGLDRMYSGYYGYSGYSGSNGLKEVARESFPRPALRPKHSLLNPPEQ